ncbi:MAG: NAD(P)-dependent oxidoreductase [Erysipelotrichaceae bacterium]
MIKIAMTKALSDNAMEYLKQFAEPIIINETEPEKVIEMINEVDALIFRGNKVIDNSFFEKMKLLGCKVYAKHGTGLDGIDLNSATYYGIPVVYAPGANSRSVAEYTVAAILSIIKKIPQCTEKSRNKDNSYRWSYLSKQFKGMTVYIIGFGNIGREVADMCIGLGMKVQAYDKYVNSKQMQEKGVKYIEKLVDGLNCADIVTLHTPLTEETDNLANAEFFNLMKKGSYFVNTARPELMDEAELVKRLNEGWLAGAVLDASSIEKGESVTGLESAKNLILSCHIAAMTSDALDTMGYDCIDGIIAVLNGKRWLKTANKDVYDRLGW